MRLLDTKETHSAKMDKQTKRLASDKKQHRLSALIVLHKPKPHAGLPLPTYFDIVGVYVDRRGSPPTAPTASITVLVHGVRTLQAMHSFFFGDKKFFDRPIKRSTTPAETKRLLVGCGAAPMGSPLQAGHIRHTALSQVEARNPDRLPEAISRARNSMEAFESKYRTAIAPEQLTMMKKLPRGPQLELMVLG